MSLAHKAIGRMICSTKKKKKEVQKPLDLSLIGLKEGLRKNRETFLISSHIALGVISLGE